MSGVDAEKSNLEKGKIVTKKVNKPMMERKRRARINKCLFEMKQMLADDIKYGSPIHSKWEKADVLEMSVAYIRQLRKSVATNSKMQQAFSLPSFIDGFSVCVREIKNYTMLEKWPTDHCKYNTRLINHLISQLQLLSSRSSVMKAMKAGANFASNCPEIQLQMYENHCAVENWWSKSRSPSPSWESVCSSNINRNSPTYNHCQQPAITVSSAFYKPQQTVSIKCTSGISAIICQPDAHSESDFFNEASLFVDSKHCSKNHESLKKTCDGYRLWRPF